MSIISPAIPGAVLAHPDMAIPDPTPLSTSLFELPDPTLDYRKENEHIMEPLLARDAGQLIRNAGDCEMRSKKDVMSCRDGLKVGMLAVSILDTMQPPVTANS
ncbi:hypothetical protein CNYM01_00524 [Colletotrichum nymphaeae SA-01]|uniref:Uncharacterized protein n=1 Tax=Colletotrichum nymphaeae SA-01 TaxID=1460502 RepID=A0A135TVM6_9PEZI|nr:hypothetical protein CNYM01_00524 [Colletotrichum nymphaeae SA-01]